MPEPCQNSAVFFSPACIPFAIFSSPFGREYIFRFHGITSNGGGIYTWEYYIEVVPPPVMPPLLPPSEGLSNFILEFCPDIQEDNITKVEISVNGGLFTELFLGADPGYEFGDIKVLPPASDPSIWGMRVIQSLDDDDFAILRFYLNLDVLPVPGDLAIKIGGGPPVLNATVFVQEDAICTPGCPDPVPTLTRGMLL